MSERPRGDPVTPTRPPRAPDALTRVVPKHHPLVRLSHWVNVPLLLGLIASGLAIYWAAPVFVHHYDPALHSPDYLVTIGNGIPRARRIARCRSSARWWSCRGGRWTSRRSSVGWSGYL